MYKTEVETLFEDSFENGVFGTESVWCILYTKQLYQFAFREVSSRWLDCTGMLLGY